ncbi:hypothetical protein HOG48_02530 [Candidatus Peregrinibacteria bacterium]|jgi:hypothetical protein|nr:hypothetical protein [Candidatus Peregrinibacteria bacterium]
MAPSVTALQKEKARRELPGIPKDAPLLVILVDDVELYHKELKRLTDGLTFLPVNFRILLHGKSTKNDHKIKNSYHVDDKELDKFFTFAHMVLFLSEKTPKNMVKEAVAHDAVPIICDSTSFLEDYDGPGEKGSCFKFKEPNSWSMYASIVRALENFGFPYDWKNIIKMAKRSL